MSTFQRRRQIVAVDVRAAGPGQGGLALQAFKNGRWQPILQFTASATPRTITIPERFTARNINENYHEAHISELRTLGIFSGLGVFGETATRWVATALKTKQ